MLRYSCIGKILCISLCILAIGICLIVLNYAGCFDGGHAMKQDKDIVFSIASFPREYALVTTVHVHYMIMPDRKVCYWQHPYQLETLIVVHSEESNFVQRDAIRNTWGSNVKTHGMGLVFFIVKANDDDEMSSAILDESYRNKDIIWTDISEDIGHSQTLHSLAMLRWVEGYCGGIKFLIKTRDDVFMNLQKLNEAIYNVKNDTLTIFGVKIDEMQRVDRNTSSDRYVAPWEYPYEFYPEYIFGPTYGISAALIPKLLEAAQDIPLMPLEDVFITGLCGNSKKAILQSVSGITSGRRINSVCIFRANVNGHFVSPSEMHQIWKEFSSNSEKC